MENQKTKVFKTIDEQIQLLKSRNLIIPDIEKAKKYLLTQNYYTMQAIFPVTVRCIQTERHLMK